jgi:hypothetical protein
MTCTNGRFRRHRRPLHPAGWLCAIVLVSLAAPLGAVVPPERSGVAEKATRNPELDIEAALRLPSQLPPAAAARAAADLAALGVPADRGRYDLRGGRWATVIPTQPLVPGRGFGNDLSWGELRRTPPAGEAALGAAAWNAFRGYLQAHQAQLRLDVGQLAATPSLTVLEDGERILLHAPRVIDGVPVRDSYVSAWINQGNLVLFGAHHWGDVEVSTVPDLPEDAARSAVQAHADPYTVTGSWGKTELVLVPVARGRQAGQITAGRGYGYRLAWVIRPSFDDEGGRWEGLVDAHSGQLLAFEDTNHYATTRQVKGGVYPETNDGSGPEGTEQAGWPMPFVDVVNSGNTYTTDAGGNLLQCVDGTITTQLRGPFMRMNDNCGAINESSSGDLDLGASGGIDCTVPAGHSAGDTHSSRSGFYEINRIKTMARSQLPANAWLQNQLQANMNINNTCNAFWSSASGTVNFYRSGGGCNNTGEIGGIFDHEWGHGMDANDNTPGISNPGEGIADIYAALRLNTSCIGRGFRLGTNCGGYGDPCTQCDGVRDIDWANRVSGAPHTFTWANANCGGGVHCRGYVYSEAVWDLLKRDLTAPPFSFDSNTAHEVVTRMTFIAAGGVGTWYSGSPPNGGCSATGGYMNYLAADDDNANLADGTPHMTAIFAAFNRHQIACGTPTVQNSGCAGNPTVAPSVTATASDRGATLSWGAVAGATAYQVFRTDGVFACDFGKTKIAQVTGTSYTDSGLQNGRDYSYTVVPIGPAAACLGPASSCTSVTPVAGANLQIDAASTALGFSSGDGDGYIDNCESATVSFNVLNVGAGSSTNTRIVDVRPVSHPAISIDTALPAAVSPSTLGSCGTGTGSFDFTAAGLSFGDTVTFEVDVTSDELFPAVKTQTMSFANAESDLQVVASRTWDFETDLEGWTVVQGTFTRSSTGGGANGSSFYVRSSSFFDNRCDQIRSPVVRLTPSSTLTVWTNFDIENFSSGSWWDRANVAVLDAGTRNAVNPSAGRAYNASGAGATCVTAGQQGWAASQPTWASSGWSTVALGSSGFAGRDVQLDIGYGTDVSVVGDGFRFDQVTLTDIELLVPDGQSDDCGAGGCGDGTCDPDESSCSCPADCGLPPSSETGLCTNGSDDDCDGDVDCADADCAADPACQTGACDNDGVCESGEDCLTCPNDCVSGSSGPACGNGVCEAGNGEDCVSCPADCNGKQNGPPSGRFCCGDGDGQSPVSCSDSRCTAGGLQCTNVPQPTVNYCCGDLVCEGAETGFNCSLDCGPPPMCGGSGSACTGNAQCCSNKCKGNGTCQ